jgi:hypothetical protein
MRRMTLIGTLLLVCAVVGLGAQENKEKKFGTALTLSEVTKISDIYASPDKYDGKRVQVQGPIVDVCAEMGCWLALGSDKEPQVLRFKVEDGVIVFPMSVKGMKAKVEGILTVTKGPGPEVNIQIKGEGAIVY